MIRLLGILIFIVFITSCEQELSEASETTNDLENTIISDAQNFRIIDKGDYKILISKNLLDNSETFYSYVLYKNEKPKNIPVEYEGITENAIYIKTPLKSIACLSTTHIAMLSALETQNALKAATNINLIYDEVLRKRISANEITELGNEGNLNYETLLDIQPDGVFTYGLNDVSQIKKLESLGLKPIVIAEFRENTPLARAEWIKFFAAFVEKEALADTIFNEVKDEYNELKSEFATIKNRPTVFTGIPFQGTWYVPAGESYLATYIRNAGGDYLWKDSKGQLSLSFDLEAVFEKAHSAEKWLDVGFVFSKYDVEKNDKRLTEFKAFDTGEMYNYTKRVHQGMGFDIYESAIVYPNLVLKDFIKILHPSELENHELVYYEKME